MSNCKSRENRSDSQTPLTNWTRLHYETIWPSEKALCTKTSYEGVLEVSKNKNCLQNLFGEGRGLWKREKCDRDGLDQIEFPHRIHFQICHTFCIHSPFLVNLTPNIVISSLNIRSFDLLVWIVAKLTWSKSMWYILYFEPRKQRNGKNRPLKKFYPDYLANWFGCKFWISDHRGERDN